MFTGKFFFIEVCTAVGADIAVTGKELAVGKPRLHVEGVDIGHALGANDAVDRNHRLDPGHRVMTAVKRGHKRAHFPANLISRVVQNSLFKTDPGLR